jgi:TonB family protein
MPAYPPNARGDGVVLVEIEMTARAAVRDYRVVSEKTGFDSAALDAAKAWRFSPPRTEASDRLFIYVVFGFRTPIAPGP